MRWPTKRVSGLRCALLVVTLAVGLQAAEEWAHGIEGQRKADLGNGSYLNPILAGDHPDPTVLRDGDTYYATFSSFESYPGLVIWQSHDLVNWTPVTAALRRYVGSVYAPDLAKHHGRYYIYFPGRAAGHRSNYVIWADDIRGPWSDPIDLKIEHIDPGHAVGQDGRRYLFLSAGLRVPLSEDGLSVTGPAKHVYDGWRYPDDWPMESFSQEGPKITRHGEYFYMTLAEGGTAGPPTSHLVVSARARSIDGPWENSPYNPIVRTRTRDEKWWSKGHASLVEGQDGRWYLMYHGYENSLQTLGRQTLLEPITWTDDGWFKTVATDLAAPIPMPAGEHGPHGFALSDDFGTSKIGIQWAFFAPSAGSAQRFRYDANSLIIAGEGSGPADCSPLTMVCGDPAYEIEVQVELLDEGASGGLLLFYSRRLYAGVGFARGGLILHRYGIDRPGDRLSALGRVIHLRLRNDANILSAFYSADGMNWERVDVRWDVSGYHHNVAGDFLSLRPALYAAGKGEVRFRNFRYRALP